MIGRSLSHYEILEEIGRGGMGVVYRATDTKLGRDVAIKILPEAFSKDKERLTRFECEARVLASLNHPNLAAIHGFEECESPQPERSVERSGVTEREAVPPSAASLKSGGLAHAERGRTAKKVGPRGTDKRVHFLVLELVPGETLAERIARGPLPLEEALSLFRQIAEAVEAAHDKGIIHRDLKPANIKITPEGKIKVLDFGLAKPFDAEPAPMQDLSQSPTLTRKTETGVILGTASYMSPEQARGLVVDKRTDVWAFGCVLFEALTGRVAFPGATLSDTLANVLAREPAWEKLPERTPASIQRLLRPSLQKDRARRLRDIGDAQLELEDTLDEPREDKSLPPSHRALPWILVGVMAAVSALALWWASRSDSGDTQRVVRTSILRAPDGSPGQFALDISPDGSRIVYSAAHEDVRKLYLRDLGETELTSIPGTEEARNPFFSPDGEWVGFFAEGSLK